jgi:hypothetical protein
VQVSPAILLSSMKAVTLLFVYTGAYSITGSNDVAELSSDKVGVLSSNGVSGLASNGIANNQD